MHVLDLGPIRLWEQRQTRHAVLIINPIAVMAENLSCNVMTLGPERVTIKGEALPMWNEVKKTKMAKNVELSL